MKDAEVDFESITSDPKPFIPPGEPPVGEPEPDPEPLGDPVYPGDPGPAEDPEIQPVQD